MNSTLIGQNVIALVFILPVSMMMLTEPSGFSFMIVSDLKLVIPLIVFSVLFGMMKSGTGVEFKFSRILVSIVLWVAAWKYQAYDLDGYLKATKSFELYTFYYDIVAGILTITLSYIICMLFQTIGEKTKKS